MEGKITFKITDTHELKKLLISCENCDWFTIHPKDILEISLLCYDDGIVNGRETRYTRVSGYIRLKESTREALSDLGKWEKKEGFDHSFSILENRLRECKDICWIDLYIGKNRYSLSAGFDPVCDFRCNEIEYSNCSSVDFLPNGEVLIGVGEHSTQPRRTDNDFLGVIEGFDKVFPDFEGFGDTENGRMLCTLERANFFYPDESPLVLCTELVCKNKGWRGTELRLLFDSPEMQSFMFERQMLNSADFGLTVMPLQNGQLVVSFSDYYDGICFICKKITAEGD